MFIFLGVCSVRGNVGSSRKLSEIPAMLCWKKIMAHKMNWNMRKVLNFFFQFLRYFQKIFCRIYQFFLISLRYCKYFRELWNFVWIYSQNLKIFPDFHLNQPFDEFDSELKFKLVLKGIYNFASKLDPKKNIVEKSPSSLEKALKMVKYLLYLVYISSFSF